jgi:hypothetical protein
VVGLSGSSSVCFLAGFFFVFVSDFRRHIYARPSTSARHAPLNRVLRRCPRLLPLAQVTPVVGVWCVACTRQRAFCSLPRVTAMFPPFSGPAQWRRGLRRLFFGWAVPLMARVDTRRHLRRILVEGPWLSPLPAL